jgi:hypothetical protein
MDGSKGRSKNPLSPFQLFGVRGVEGPRTVGSRNREIANSEIPKSGSWSRVEFIVSDTGSWKDKEPGRARMQEFQNPKT